MKGENSGGLSEGIPRGIHVQLSIALQKIVMIGGSEIE